MPHTNIRFNCLNPEEDDLCRHIREGSCGAAVSFETLEHLNDPGRAADQFSRILMPEGFFICSVPNVISESEMTPACQRIGPISSGLTFPRSAGWWNDAA